MSRRDAPRSGQKSTSCPSNPASLFKVKGGGEKDRPSCDQQPPNPLLKFPCRMAEPGPLLRNSCGTAQGERNSSVKQPQSHRSEIFAHDGIRSRDRGRDASENQKAEKVPPRPFQNPRPHRFPFHFTRSAAALTPSPGPRSGSESSRLGRLRGRLSRRTHRLRVSPFSRCASFRRR